MNKPHPYKPERHKAQLNQASDTESENIRRNTGGTTLILCWWAKTMQSIPGPQFIFHCNLYNHQTTVIAGHMTGRLRRCHGYNIKLGTLMKQQIFHSLQAPLDMNYRPGCDKTIHKTQNRPGAKESKFGWRESTGKVPPQSFRDHKTTFDDALPCLIVYIIAWFAGEGIFLDL